MHAIIAGVMSLRSAYRIARLVEDDASARPVFVFVGLHNCTQGGLDSPVTAPVIPGFVVARAVGQTIAARPARGELELSSKFLLTYLISL
jgi:hypothetical protein